MSETNNNLLKPTEKQIVVPANQIGYNHIIGDGFFHKSDSYTIGLVETKIDETVSFAAPNSTNNAFYSRMLNAMAVELNTIVQTGTSTNMEAWYKIRTNAVSAHKNRGKGVYNVELNHGMSTNPHMYIYDVNGNLVGKDENGSTKASFSLDFGETYFLRVKAFQENGFTLGVSYENVGGEADNCTTEIVSNALEICADLPNFANNYRFKKAELTLYKNSAILDKDDNLKLGIYNFDTGVYPGFSVADCGNLCDYVLVKGGEEGEGVTAYTFDITQNYEHVVEQGNYGFDFLIKPITTDTQTANNITFYGENSNYAPKITITCESNHAVGNYYRSDSHEIGRFGQGSIDLQFGNLMFESEDFAWGGSRMPVTIKHLYNSMLYRYQYTVNENIGINTANFDAMKLGLGFKLNIMQSMVKVTGENKYIYTGENGEEVHLLKKADNDNNGNNGNIFVSSQEDGELEYNAGTHILDNGDKYLFDENGRLIKITDGDNENNAIEIVYTDNKLTSVKDAVNRVFTFAYNSNGNLVSITAPDSAQITYAYTGDLLSAVNYPNGKSVQITYSNQKPKTVTLYDNGAPVYKFAYTFKGYSVSELIEYGYENGVAREGIRKTYTYSQSQGRTVVSTNENLKQTVYVFNDDGEVTNEYIVPQFSNSVPLEDAKGVTTVNNLLIGHDFENYSTTTNWSEESANLGNLSFELVKDEKDAVYGKNYLRITSNNSGAVRNGIYQTAYMQEGDFTLSAYVRVKSGFQGKNDGAYLSIYQAGIPEAFVNSEKLKFTNNEFVRLSVTFPNGCNTGYSAAIMLDGAGEVEVNAPQFEFNSDANSYNLISNSSPDNQTGWSIEDASYDSNEGFRFGGSVKITGNLDSQKSSGQTVTVKSAESTRETFKLSGWAKGYALPAHNDEEKGPTFRLRAVINYADGTTTENPITADFCPNISDWQYAEVEFSKDAYKKVTNIQVYCDYDYNYGDAYFDDIELMRTNIETGLSEEDFAVEEDYTDQEDNTTNSNQKETEETEEFDAFAEFVDDFGNTLTETTFTDGEFGTIYRSFGYDQDNNNLVKETDARGYSTEYAVDETTSRNQEVTDRLGNKTAYEYDESGRTTKVTSKNSENQELATVSYGYNSFDDLTQIVRGDGLKYVLKYDAFRNLESIGIDGKTDGDLIKYTYTRGGRIRSMTYANGDKMTAYYDGQGNMITEEWVDKKHKGTVLLC